MKQSVLEYKKLLEQEGLLVEFAEPEGKEGEDRPVTLVTYFSGGADQGTLFLCKGAAFKEAYLKDAVNRGAVAYVSEKKYEAGKEIPALIVNDARKAQFVLGEAFYIRPFIAVQQRGARAGGRSEERDVDAHDHHDDGKLGRNVHACTVAVDDGHQGDSRCAVVHELREDGSEKAHAQREYQRRFVSEEGCHQCHEELGDPAFVVGHGMGKGHHHGEDEDDPPRHAGIHHRLEPEQRLAVDLEESFQQIPHQW